MKRLLHRVLLVGVLLLSGLVTHWQPVGAGAAAMLASWLPTPIIPQRADARARTTASLQGSAAINRQVVARWQYDALQALEEPLKLDQPYAERLHVEAGRSVVAAYAIDLQTPRVLEIASTASPGAQGGLIIDVLPPVGAGDVPFASFGPAMQDTRWSVPAAGEYRLRVQSTIGARGGFGFSLAERRTLGFPVDTPATDAVRSLFGAARDGGRRQHHGIDIFAARGTPVLAAADGIVARVNESPRGGLHIWQRAVTNDGSALGSLYYAHLESVDVLPGTQIERGMRIGTVGNTGNARTTPPHLHFGWYRYLTGPADPLPLVGSARAVPLPLESGHDLPRWLGVAAPVLNRRSGPGTNHAVTGTLQAGYLVEVRGISGAWVRVADADGSTSFVARSQLSLPAVQPLTLSTPAILKSEPADDGPQIAVLDAGVKLDQLGRHGGFVRVRTDAGRWGWLLEPNSRQSDADSPSQE